MVFSEEPNQAVWTDDGRLVSQIRTYKGARSMGKSVVGLASSYSWPDLETAFQASTG